jgi:two-component system, OmpR family, aerobic respiration control sensor histidine kinase ArcB
MRITCNTIYSIMMSTPNLMNLLRWLLLNIAITGLYFFLAKFGMAWSSLTSNITLVWPAAGLALFCFFTFGWRIAPAIFFGSFLATQLLHFNQLFKPDVTIILLAMTMAFADALQAWVIARFNQSLMKTDFNQSILRLLPFVASVFVACFISCTLGTVVLHHLQIVTHDELYKSWLFWWMGDSAGMLLLAPILLWIGSKIQGKENPKARALLLLSSVTGVSIFVLAAIGYMESGLANDFEVNWIQVIALIGCLLVISLLIAYVHVQQKNDDLLASNQQKLQDDIDLHTESLRAANDWLLKEIADRKLTQDLLEKSQQDLFQREQHLRSLLDNIPDPVWLKNIDGIYLSCNKAFATFLGLPENELVGKNENELVSAETAKDFKINDEKALQNNHQPHRYEQWLLSSDGSKHLLDTLKVGIKNLQGEVIGVLGIARDITEKHQLISALQIARDTAEEATKSKSRFLANMSHEIRTPLNAVLGYTQLLIRDKDMSHKQQEKLSAILTSGHKLLDLINDILDLSKIESGALNIKQDYFDLHQEMSTVITVIADRARTKNLPVYTHFAIPKPFIVKGDRQKLGQILINLLSNAIKFTSQGQINIELLPTHSGIEFIVTDTGTGIAEKELSELFIAFKQGIAGEDAGGTGLGLTLSRHLAEAMGGSLQLQSQVGVGTKAFLHLPLKEEMIQLPDHDFEQIKSISLSKAVNVLVVEDDIASNNILVDLLLQTGCDVSSAINGREGLEKASAKKFDLIFTDIRMPDVNGLEMLRTLRKQSAYQYTPIIAVSASSLEHEREYYLAQGFHDFIGKPYAFDEIYKALIKFADAQYDESVSENTDDNLDLSNDEIDLQKIHTELKILLAYAAQGDMSNTKSTIAKLDTDVLGKQNHQQLMTALKNYQLEKVEALVKNWLESVTQ